MDFFEVLLVLASPIHKDYSMRQNIGAVIIEKNIFAVRYLL